MFDLSSLSSHYFIIFLSLPFLSFFLLSLLQAWNHLKLPSSLTDWHGDNDDGGMEIRFCGGGVEIMVPWWNHGYG